MSVIHLLRKEGGRTVYCGRTSASVTADQEEATCVVCKAIARKDWSPGSGRPAIQLEVADEVEAPAHYTQGNIDTIDLIRETLGDGFVDYALGNTMKYISRWKYKGGHTDLLKAQVYMNWAVEFVEKQPEEADND